MIDKKLSGWWHPELLVSSSVSGWTSVMTGVPQGSILGPVLFNNFISDLVRLSAPSANLQDDTKLSGAVGTSEGWDAIQKKLDKLKKWAHVNLMRFNKAKYRVLHPGWGDPWYEYRLGDVGIESSPAKYCWMKSWTSASNICLQPRRPTVPWAASKELLTAGQGR